MNVSTSSSILNESSSSFYQSPILGEIFELKSCINNKKLALYNLSISIFLCLTTFLLITTSDETYVNFILFIFDYDINESFLNYLIASLKMVLFLTFITFCLSLIHSTWYLVTSSIKKLSLNVLNKKLNNQQKVLLGANLFDQDKEESNEQQHHQHQDLKQSGLPYFTLISPTKTPTKSPSYSKLLNVSSAAAVNQRDENEAVNLNEKYVNSFFTKLEENEQQKENSSYNYNYEVALGSDDAFERYNYQQKQRNFLDSSLELRNYQYQIGSRPISFPVNTVATSPTTTSTTSAQSPITTPTRTFEHFLKSSSVKHENYFTDEINNSESNDQTQTTAVDDLRLLSFDDIQIEQIWCKKFNLNRTRLDIERENLRKWVSLTILKPIIKEIHSINDQIVKLGNHEIKIGQASVSQINIFVQLNSSALSPKLLRSIPILIPYLELTKRQEYLIQRLNELAINGCISGYHWNNGGLYNNKEWIDFLPTDASLLMHTFCTYMDSRLLPRYPNLKPFTTQYFYKEQNKKIDSSSIIESKQEPAKSSQQQSQQLIQVKQEFSNMKLYIDEFRSDPPCYRVVFNKDVFEVIQGRNNLFDSILCFLHIAKQELNSMLGAVDLGPSGVNLMSVID